MQLFCMMSLTEARRVLFVVVFYAFFGSWAGFISEEWVKNKYFFGSPGPPKDIEPNPSVLHKHFPPVETVIGSMCQG